MKSFFENISKYFSATTFLLSESEIGLLFEDGRFMKVLTTGKYRFRSWGKNYQLKIIDLKHEGARIQQDAETLFLAEKYPEKFAELIEKITTKEGEIAFIEKENRLIGALPPASTGFVWKEKTPYQIKIEKIDDATPVPPQLWQRIKQCKMVEYLLQSQKLLTTATIPAQHIGLHFINETFTQTFPAGEYAWWTLGSKMNMLAVDLRLQNIEISGQEILTKDRVSIRLNLLATWQVINAEKLLLNVKNYNDFLYREMQLALRTVVATKTLDELLADKNLLNDEIKNIVLPIAEDKGIEVQSVGVKDVILPGEMKDILSKVVEAQKMAEANSIRLREETQATRSLHNTAKVMENNPTLLRLKELETLERITAQINQLNVYGGLDEVMNKLINLRDLPAEKK